MQVCTLLQTDNHANTSPLSFLQAGCPSCRPTNSVKASLCQILSILLSIGYSILICVTMPNFVEIGHFNGFLKRPHLPFWIFLNVKFLTADGVRRLLLHHHIKFHGDLSMHCGNIVFLIFKMAAVPAILSRGSWCPWIY